MTCRNLDPLRSLPSCSCPSNLVNGVHVSISQNHSNKIHFGSSPSHEEESGLKIRIHMAFILYFLFYFY
jgi:hypothetical protein